MTVVSFTRHAGGSLIVTIDGVDQLAPITPASFDGADLIHVQPHPNPSRITLALDARGLDGPEVDEALGVAEPAVDQWETGELIPNPGDIARLATLTGYHPAWFYGDDLPVIETGFICQRSGPGRGCRQIINGEVIEPAKPAKRRRDPESTPPPKVDHVAEANAARARLHGTR